MNVFNLKAQVTLDTGEYKKRLQDAEKQSETSAKKIGDNFSKTSEATAAQLKSIQSQYNDLVRSSGSVLTSLDELAKNGLDTKTEYAKELERFKAQEQEIIDRAKEMGIAFENGKFKIVSAQEEETRAAKEHAKAIKEQEQAAKKAAQEQEKKYKNVANVITTIGSNLGMLSPIATSTGKIIGEAATNAGGVWAKIAELIIKIIGLMKQLISETIEYSNEIYEVSKQFDMTTESVSELQYMASQTGTTLSTITNAMTQLERKAASESFVFKELGVSITDANGNYKSMETVLFDTIGALNDLNDENEKSAYMSQLFGRTTMENGELFRLTADEIANLRQESEDLGITMSESTAKFGADYKRQIEALKLQGKSALSAFLADEDGAEEKLQNFFDNVVIVAEEYLPKFLSFGIKLITAFGTSLLRYLPQLASEVISILIDTIFEINWWQVGIDIGKAVIEGFLNIFVSAYNALFGKLFGKAKKVDLNVGQSIYGGNDTNFNTEYEISERVQQDITVKVEASGDTAISKESAEETAKALAPYIDQILGAK